MSIYGAFGVRPIINGVGPATRLGGTIMDDEVLEAMGKAGRAYVKIDELQEAAGRVIAEITGAEAGYITSGAAAGLALATAACMTGLDPVKVNQLPDTRGMKHQVVIHRAHRYDYDHAIRSVGATLVEIGFPDGTFPYELEAAITPDTAAIAYFPTPIRPAVPLPTVIEIARRHDVPVIVDGALEVPPVENLRTFVSAGADLVVYSGGKSLRGPQASGFVCGRTDLIRAIAFHHQDMDVHPETWTYRQLIAEGMIPGPPHHGIGRTMKVGKEEIIGLLVALQRYVREDRQAEREAWNARVSLIVQGLADQCGVTTEIIGAFSKSGSVPYAVIRLDESRIGRTAYQVLELLQKGEPRVYLNEERAWNGCIVVNPMTLLDEEVPVVVRRLRETISQ
jgi:D-glucosaminate-6-phosphate ammonia-lyase